MLLHDIFNSWQYCLSNACLGETRKKLFAFLKVASEYLPADYISQHYAKVKTTPAADPVYRCTPSPPKDPTQSQSSCDKTKAAVTLQLLHHESLCNN